MSEVIEPLTTDELAVLEICVRGGSIAPIGRWEKPVRALTQRGLLNGLDAFNYVITDAGRDAHESQEREVDRALGEVIERGSANMRAQLEITDTIEAMAQSLAKVARASALVTGDDEWHAAARWCRIMMDRTKEILQERPT